MSITRRFNLVGAVPIHVDEWFIDVSLRGRTTADNFYQTETAATDLPNACGG